MYRAASLQETAPEGAAAAVTTLDTPPPAKRLRNASPPQQQQQRQRRQQQHGWQEQQVQQQQAQERQHGASQQQQDAQQQRHPEELPMPALLLALAEPLLLRVLATLCPEDLLATSRTCRRLLAHGSDGALWRRLYHARCVPAAPCLLPVRGQACARHVCTRTVCRPCIRDIDLLQACHPCCRWRDGPQQEDAEHVQGSSWLRLYLERDALVSCSCRRRGHGVLRRAAPHAKGASDCLQATACVAWYRDPSCA